MEVLAAEFLPADGQLFLIVWDAEGGMHVLQYDPENPKTAAGQRLLLRGAFNVGHIATPGSTLLLPSTLAPFADQQVKTNGQTNGDDPQQHDKLHHILHPTSTGSIGLLTPLDEPTYRRLSALQAQLTNILEHAAGLNPRAHRIVEHASGMEGGRAVVDGSLVQRVGELGASKRAEVLGRAGMDGWVLRSDLEVVGGGGLGYL